MGVKHSIASRNDAIDATSTHSNVRIVFGDDFVRR
jgi:hypothetical protein